MISKDKCRAYRDYYEGSAAMWDYLHSSGVAANESSEFAAGNARRYALLAAKYDRLLRQPWRRWFS